MISLPGLQLVLAEGITSDQLKQLAAVMLGLVVFAAVFALVERQRVRRGRQEDHTDTLLVEDPVQPPTVEYPPWTAPPQHAEDGPPLPATAEQGEINDELPVPFVPRSHEPAGAAFPPASAPPDAVPTAPAGAPGAASKVSPPEAAHSKSEPPETSPVHQAEGHQAEEPSPETPDDIGIIIPDEPPRSRQPDQA